jgi:signal transduction histidine kinase
MQKEGSGPLKQDLKQDSARPSRSSLLWVLDHWILPIALLLGCVWLLLENFHQHKLDLTWSGRFLSDSQWSPSLTLARAGVDAAQCVLGMLGAALTLRYTLQLWRYPLAAVFLVLGVVESGLVATIPQNVGNTLSVISLLVLFAALAKGVLQRSTVTRATPKLLLWGYAGILLGVGIWKLNAASLEEILPFSSTLGVSQWSIIWYSLLSPMLRDLGLGVWLICAGLVWLERSPGTLRNGVFRSLVFLGLSLCIALVFTLIVGGMGSLVGTQESFALSILAATVVAWGIEPARAALTRSLRRLLYGERDDPYAIMQRLSVQLKGPSAGDSIKTQIQDALGSLAGAMKLPRVTLEWIDGEILSYGTALLGQTEPNLEQNLGQHQNSEVFALIAGGEKIGTLRVARRGGGEPFTPAELRLLEGVARQLASTAYSWQLSEQLLASQLRLIRAGEEERRRIRRDLHDGLGPSLSGLGLKLEAAAILMRKSPEQAAERLTQLKTEVQQNVSEIRRMVHDLRPPKLDDLGLVGALEELLKSAEQSGLKTYLEVAQPLPPLGAALEVAVYRLAQEAVTNVVKHAQAQKVHLRVWIEANHFFFECRDDGIGLPEVRQAGVGTRSMRERVGALSGRVELRSSASRGTGAGQTSGTVVLAQLPLGMGA